MINDNRTWIPFIAIVLSCALVVFSGTIHLTTISRIDSRIEVITNKQREVITQLERLTTDHENELTLRKRWIDYSDDYRQDLENRINPDNPVKIKRFSEFQTEQ